MDKRLVNEIKSILWKNKLLSEISDIDGMLASEGISVGQYQNGTCIIDSQNYFPSVFVIIRGKVNVYKDNEGKDVFLKTSSKGDVLGLAGLFGNDEKYESRILSASSKTTVLFIKQEIIEREIKNNPTFALAYIKLLSDKIRYLNAKIGIYTGESVEKKFSSYILENAVSAEDGSMILSAVNYQSILRLLDISRASIYRARESLVQKKLIRVSDKAIVINDLDALRKYISD